MKKTLLIAICFSLFLFSCKKSEAPKNTVTFTVDGINKKYPNASASIGDYLAQGSNLSFVAYTDANNIAESISFTITANTSLTKGGVYRTDDKTGAVRITYYPSDYTLAKQNSYLTKFGGQYVSTITITSLSDTNVQGTFSGQLVLNGGNTVKTISDGKFNATIQ